MLLKRKAKTKISRKHSLSSIFKSTCETYCLDSFSFKTAWRTRVILSKCIFPSLHKQQSLCYHSILVSYEINKSNKNFAQHSSVLYRMPCCASYLPLAPVKRYTFSFKVTEKYLKKKKLSVAYPVIKGRGCGRFSGLLIQHLTLFLNFEWNI